jgi:hypothetical protein
MAKEKSSILTTGEEILTLQAEFYGGIQRDDLSNVGGGASNVEELDILENANFVRPTKVLSPDTLPTNTSFHSYCEDPLNGDGYAVGSDNNSSTNVQVFQNRRIASTNPGGWSSVGSSAGLVSVPISASTCHYEVESGATSIIPTLAIYFVANGNQIGKWTSAGNAVTTPWVLSTFVNSTMSHISFREIAGISYICAGNNVSTIDPGSPSTGANFNEVAFPLPFGYIAVDICQAGEYFFVLASSSNLLANRSVIFIWDGVSSTYTDQIPVSMGGPQWLYNFKQTITICCASNGIMQLFYLSAPTVGAIVHKYPNIRLTNVQPDDQVQYGMGGTGPHGNGFIAPVSPSKSVFVKDDILYFALWKFDKTALYALGQLDIKFPFALWLAKRFSTADYSQMIPYAAYCFGSKIFASFQTGYWTQANNATNASFCDPATASHSSQAVFQSVWIDDDLPMNPKVLQKLYATAYPMPAGCSIALSFASDYGTTFATVYQNSSVVMNILNAIFAIFSALGGTNKKLFQWQVLFTSRQAISTTLTSAISTYYATSIAVTSGTGIANGDIILIDQEQMTVTAGGGTTTLTVTRGTNGTIKTPHTNIAPQSSLVTDLSVCPTLTAVGMRKTIKPLDA